MGLITTALVFIAILIVFMLSLVFDQNGRRKNKQYAFINWIHLNLVSLIILIIIAYIPAWIIISLIWQLFDKSHVNFVNFIFIQLITMVTLSVSLFLLYAFYGKTKRDPLYSIKEAVGNYSISVYEKTKLLPFVVKRNHKKLYNQEMLQIEALEMEIKGIQNNPPNLEKIYGAQLKILNRISEEVDFEILPESYFLKWQEIKFSVDKELQNLLKIKKENRLERQKVETEKKKRRKIKQDKKRKQAEEEERAKAEALRIFEEEEAKLRKEKVDSEFDRLNNDGEIIKQIQRFIYGRLEELTKNPNLSKKDSNEYEFTAKQLQTSFDSGCADFTEYLIKHDFIKNTLEISENQFIVIQLIDKESGQPIQKIIQLIHDYKAIQQKNQDLEHELKEFIEKRNEEIKIFKKTDITLNDIEVKKQEITQLIDGKSFREHLVKLMLEFDSWDVGQNEGSYYCSVCRKEITFDDLSNGAMVSCPLCNNKFHRKHFLEVLKVTGICPACRAKVRQDQII